MVCSEKIMLYCKDGKGSSSEVGETHRSGKSNDYRRQKAKIHSESSLTTSVPAQYRYFSAKTNWKVNSVFLPHPGTKIQLLVSEAVSLAAAGSNTLLAPNSAPELHQLGPSHSHSHIQTQWLLPLLQHPFQNPIRSTGKNNYKLLPGCQTPLEVFLFLPLLKMLSAKPSLLPCVTATSNK